MIFATDVKFRSLLTLQNTKFFYEAVTYVLLKFKIEICELSPIALQMLWLGAAANVVGCFVRQ